MSNLLQEKEKTRNLLITSLLDLSLLSPLSLMFSVCTPTCTHKLIFNERSVALQLIQQKDAFLVSEQEGEQEGEQG